MAKTVEEKIQIKQEEIAQSQNELKLLIQQKKEADRKARTSRLIRRGAILEGIMGASEDFTDEQIRALLATALSSDAGREALFDLREGQAEEVASEAEEIPAEKGA